MEQTNIEEMAIQQGEDGKAQIEERIFNIRGKQVMIDKDLAQLYGVETKVLNQAVKRNIERFPTSFMFQLEYKEFIELVTDCDRYHFVPFWNILSMKSENIKFQMSVNQ